MIERNTSRYTPRTALSNMNRNPLQWQTRSKSMRLIKIGVFHRPTDFKRVPEHGV